MDRFKKGAKLRRRMRKSSGWREAKEEEGATKVKLKGKERDG